MKKFGACEH